MRLASLCAVEGLVLSRLVIGDGCVGPVFPKVASGDLGNPVRQTSAPRLKGHFPLFEL
jgi:hypothetical protein